MARPETRPQKIDYWRKTIPGSAGSGVAETIYEVRGIRSLKLVEFNDHRLTLQLAALEGTPASTYASLMEAADHWINDKSEKTFRDVMTEATVAKAKAPPEEHSEIDDFVFRLWSSAVGERQGYLSPAAIAARFIASSDYLHRRVKGDVELLGAIYAFADAWHWTHFEAHSEHELAAMGLQSAEGRAGGPVAVKRSRQIKRRIIEMEYRHLVSDTPNSQAAKSPKLAAGLLFDRVNEVLSESKLRPVAFSSLKKKFAPSAPAIRTNWPTRKNEASQTGQFGNRKDSIQILAS